MSQTESQTENFSQSDRTASHRDHVIARNEDAKQTASAIRVSGWAIGVAAIIVLAAILMVRIITGPT
jgi:tetrahydromethanopterin S-methyltransferase subunit F